jgi:hypothetical protein
MSQGLIIFAGALVAVEYAAAKFGKKTSDGDDWFNHADVFERGNR